MIRAAVRIGGIIGGASSAQLQSLTGYAEDIGLAFQIADDVLNMVGTREELGKDAGTDEKRGKKHIHHFLALMGLDNWAMNASNGLSIDWNPLGIKPTRFDTWLPI